MFTGIITDIGHIRHIEHRGDLRAQIGTAYDAAGIEIGASIACDGCCLTVIDRGSDAEGNWFEVDISSETLARTALGHWAADTSVNLERSLKVGDELGGHIVSGHIDGVATILSVTPDGDSMRYLFEAPRGLMRFIAPKGSVALNGTSLTVNEVEPDAFGVNIIPHTQEVTTWNFAAPGDMVNVEIDTLARYVARLAETAE